MKKITLTTFEKHIKDIKVQGARSVALTTLQHVILVARSYQHCHQAKDLWRLRKIADRLANLRPTEPMARNLVSWFINSLIPQIRYNEWQVYLKKQEQKIKLAVASADSLISQYGSRLIKSGINIFTHCHSSQVESILKQAKEAAKKFTVWHTETRPLFQGRITDRRLRRAGIKSVLVVDSAAAWLVSNHSGDRIKINLVFLGADCIEPDGSVINKIGSFGIALAAYESQIPVYIVASLLKLDWDKQSIIEIRPGKEIWLGAPHGTKIINFAFDKIPAKFITGIVTEAGIIKPAQVKKAALKFYPWLKS